MSAPAFKVGESVTVCGGFSGGPRAEFKVAKVAARVTLSDGSVWHLPRHSTQWRLYGEHEPHDRYCFIRKTQPSDAVTIRKELEERKAEAEHKRLVGRVVGLGWREVDALPTESLRTIVALLDAAKVSP